MVRASLNQALQAGRRVELEAITSVATSLGAKQVCEQAFAWAQQRSVRSVTVSDAQAVGACLQFIEDHRIVVEPACGAALAVGCHLTHELSGFKSVLMIVCGGVTAGLEQLRGWSQTLGLPSPRQKPHSLL